jgi:hypothetical protein
MLKSLGASLSSLGGIPESEKGQPTQWQYVRLQIVETNAAYIVGGD